jgi:hypothetical protein
LRWSKWWPPRAHELSSGCNVKPSCCMRPKVSETVQDEEILPSPPCGKRTDNAPKVRFCATVGEEPEIELALV